MALPQSSDTATPATRTDSAEDIVDLLGEDDVKDDKPKDKEDKPKDKEDKPKDKEDKTKDKDDDVIDLEDDDDEDLEDPDKIKLKEGEEDKDDDEEEDLENIAPPRVKELEAAYPGINKKFPFLAKMLARDRQYTELFGSFDDARQMHSDFTELQSKAEVFDTFESELLSGNLVGTLQNVKETDDTAFDRIVDEYLPMLHKVDKEAYLQVVHNVAKQFIIKAFETAKENDDDDLKAAAVAINKFIFGSSKWNPPTRRTEERKEGEEPSKEAQKIADERRQLLQERYDEARGNLTTRVDNVLKATVEAYIDPRNVMPTIVKRNAIREVIEAVHASLEQNGNLKKTIDGHWRTAFAKKFDKDSMGRIQSTYLGAAKRVLGSKIKDVRSSVLKELGKVKTRDVKDDDDDIEDKETPGSTGKKHAGRPASRDRNSDKNKMRPGETVADFLARD